MSPDRLQRAADHTEDANKVSGREDGGLDISVQGVEAVKSPYWQNICEY